MNNLFERIYAKSLENKAVIDNKEVHLTPLRDVLKQAQNYFKRNLLDKTIETKEGKKISITEKGFNELFFSIGEALRGGSKGAADVFKSRADDEDYWYDVLSIVVSLEDILKDMEFDYSKPNYKKEKKPNIERYDTYSCEVLMDDELHDTKIRVEVDKDNKKKYYFHYIN